jgi:hypothetical protein
VTYKFQRDARCHVRHQSVRFSTADMVQVKGTTGIHQKLQQNKSVSTANQQTSRKVLKKKSSSKANVKITVHRFKTI